MTTDGSQNFSAMREAEQWTAEAERSLVGSRDQLAGNVEAQKMWDRMQLYPAYRQERLVVRTMLQNMADSMFNTFADRIESEEKIRQETHQKLEILRKESQEFFEAAGKVMRAKSGFSELAEEGEVLAISSFVNSLRNIKDVDEFINVLEDDEGYIRMMAEMYDVPAPPVDDLTDPLASPDHHKLLDPGHPNYLTNVAALRHFIKSGNAKNGEKSGERKNLEAKIWGSIIRKMNHEQLVDLFDVIYGGGQAGAEEAMNLMLTLVNTGILTDQQVAAIVTDPELANRAKAATTKEYNERIQKAHANFKQTEEAMAGAVQYMKMRVHGNPVKQTLTFKNLLIGRLFEFGILTAAFNAVLEVTSRYKGQKTFSGKMKAIAEGLGATAVNPYFHLGLLEVGVATDVAGSGIVREKLLYSPSKVQKEKNIISETENQVKDTLKQHPGMADYVYGHYDRFLDVAQNNQVTGKKYQLLDTDVDLSADNLKKWHLPNTKEGKKMALEALNDVFHFFSRVVKLRDWKNVAAFMIQEGVAFDARLYPEYTEHVRSLREKLKKYPGLTRLMAQSYDDMVLIAQGETGGKQLDFTPYLDRWGYRTDAEKQEGMRVVRAAISDIFTPLRNVFYIEDAEELKRFFKYNKISISEKT